ncbi:hypothetical protein FAM09_24540 [Niastella caeni]|uniref:Lipoprotein n=1 Tax=Niastella caeni TaxID=2569763 RepID=A0A4S8HI40_9BACT|nr:hypothetical protein [Niastella caeni]THU34191.1 hypothetical protein FAM09_24540 [Niastella caeni]
MKNVLIVFTVLVTLVSCSKSDNDNPAPPTPPSPTDSTGTTPVTPASKRWLLTYVDAWNSFNYNMELQYDSSRHLKKIKVSQLLAEFNVYHKDDTINHIVYAGSYGAKSSAIFLYRSDKRCHKVIYKKRVYTYNYPPGGLDDSNPYFSNTTDGEFDRIDSLVYSSTNQLTEVWHKSYGEVMLHKFIYTDLQKTAPERAETYVTDGQGNFPLRYKVLLTTNDQDYPGYQFLWVYPFINHLLTVHATLGIRMPVTPYDTPAYSASMMVLIQKCITKHVTYNYYSPSSIETSSDFSYFYSADSTSFTGRYVMTDAGFPKFKYLFKKF